MPPFSLMLHHFFDSKKHPNGQGAISESDFESLLDYVETKYNLHSAEEWMERALAGSLGQNDVCLSFDDGLRCQYDIALPILERRGLKAFWFVYSSVFRGEVGKMELYRFYRTTRFKSISKFYDEFKHQLMNFDFYTKVKKGLHKFDVTKHLSNYPIYTYQDKEFRFIRDILLEPEEFEQIMDSMVAESGIKVDALFQILWMDNTCIRNLHDLGHIVGLHSYSHPTKLNNLTKDKQLEEYMKNHKHLKEITGKNPDVVSHPCGSYNKDTLDVLNSLGVKLGFRSNMLVSSSHSLLELPRKDHSDLMLEAGLR